VIWCTGFRPTSRGSTSSSSGRESRCTVAGSSLSSPAVLRRLVLPLRYVLEIPSRCRQGCRARRQGHRRSDLRIWADAGSVAGSRGEQIDAALRAPGGHTKHSSQTNDYRLSQCVRGIEPHPRGRLRPCSALIYPVAAPTGQTCRWLFQLCEQRRRGGGRSPPIRVLRLQAGRPRLRRRDRVFMAAISWALP